MLSAALPTTVFSRPGVLAHAEPLYFASRHQGTANRSVAIVALGHLPKRHHPIIIPSSPSPHWGRGNLLGRQRLGGSRLSCEAGGLWMLQESQGGMHQKVTIKRELCLLAKLHFCHMPMQQMRMHFKRNRDCDSTGRCGDLRKNVWRLNSEREREGQREGEGE